MAQRAILSWTPAEDGGRAAPPEGQVYSTVARFEDDIDHWPRTAWSVVIRSVKGFPGQRHELVEMSFLQGDAPQHLLRRGSRFELLEGSRRVAKGVVLDAAVEIPSAINEFQSALIG